MSDEYDDTDYFQIVDVENELEKRRNEQPESPNLAGTPTKKLGCVSAFLWLIAIVWLIAGLFWAIAELISLFF